MAIAPLFVASMTALKTSLRLEGAKAAGALATVDDAVRDVRLGFYAELGLTRVAELVALSSEENPDDANSLLRARAEQTEIKWVRLLLKERMPSLLLDGSAIKQQVWNDEGAFAMKALSDREIQKLKDEIAGDLEILAGDAEVESRVQAETIGPEAGTVDALGASVWFSQRVDQDEDDAEA